MSSRPLSRRIIATSRRWWRQLTSMRTALILLLILAIAAVPGSLLPQRNLNADQVSQYYADHPDSAPILDRLWAFDVYSSPWFSAIYLLLFVSLVGCLVPRLRDHVRALRRRPPDAPARMNLLPQHQELPDGTTADRVTKALRRERFRVAVREHDGGAVTVSAQKGYLRDAGNLLFHFSMLGLLIGLAIGSLFGWNGNRILVEGADGAFCNSLQQYDEYGLGPSIDASSLPPFCVQMDSFEDKYLDNGQPTQFTAHVRYGEDGAAPSNPYTLEVNSPLELNGATVFLLGHGYAPVISYHDRYGVTQTSTTPFIGDDGSGAISNGAAVFPDANVDPETGEQDEDGQVAFEGVFSPSSVDGQPFAQSASPGIDNPALMLTAYRGDTGLDSGKPQSVYSVDPDQISSGALEVVDTEMKVLKVGDSLSLGDGEYVTFDGYREYGTLEVRYDPGEGIVLAAAITMLAGLLPALLVRRRRVWVRIGGDGTAIAGGLARTEFEGFTDEFKRLVTAFGGSAEPPDEPADETDRLESSDVNR